MARMLRLSIGLLAVSVLSVFGLHFTRGQEATPPPFFELPAGIHIDALASTPNMKFAADTEISISVDRYTYQPGVTFELEYPGPVFYYVEQGRLALGDVDGLILGLIYQEGNPSPGPLPVSEGDRYIILPGNSVFAEGGRLGPTQNAGDEQLVVLALLIVENPGGVTWAVTGDPDATPMNEIEIP